MSCYKMAVNDAELVCLKIHGNKLYYQNDCQNCDWKYSTEIYESLFNWVLSFGGHQFQDANMFQVKYRIFSCCLEDWDTTDWACLSLDTAENVFIYTKQGTQICFKPVKVLDL